MEAFSLPERVYWWRLERLMVSNLIYHITERRKIQNPALHKKLCITHCIFCWSFRLTNKHTHSKIHACVNLLTWHKKRNLHKSWFYSQQMVSNFNRADSHQWKLHKPHTHTHTFYQSHKEKEVFQGDPLIGHVIMICLKILKERGKKRQTHWADREWQGCAEREVYRCHPYTFKRLAKHNSRHFSEKTVEPLPHL